MPRTVTRRRADRRAGRLAKVALGAVICWALLASVATVSLILQHTRDLAALQKATRALNISRAVAHDNYLLCLDRNQRNQQTIRILRRLAAHPAPGVSRRQAQPNLKATETLIQALVPYRDCKREPL